MSFDSSAAKIKASDNFRKEVLRAAAVASGQKKVKSSSEQVLSIGGSGWQVFKEYELMSEKDFQEWYGMSARDANVAVEKLRDECGHEGHFIVYDTGAPRRLRIWSDVYVNREEHILPTSSVLRGGQAAEVRQMYLDDLKKSGDAPRVSVNNVGVPTLRRLQEMVHKREEEMRVAAAAAQAAMPVAPPAPQRAVGEKDNEDESSEEEDGAFVLPSQRRAEEAAKKRKQAEKKAKPSAKNNAKRAKAASSDVPPLTLTRAHLATLAADTSSKGPSVGSIPADARSAISMGSQKTGKDKWRSSLDIGRILEGSLIPGSVISSCQKAVESMEMAGDAESTEQAVSTKALLAVANAAKDSGPTPRHGDQKS